MSGGSALRDRDTSALQDLVTADDAAVFGLGTYGGRLAVQAPHGPGLAMLTAGYDAHRLRRDAWSAALRGLGAPVPAAAAAYSVPDTPLTPATMAAAADLERRCCAAYVRALGDLTTPALRAQAVAALQDSARRAATLLALAGEPAATASQALPGQEG